LAGVLKKVIEETTKLRGVRPKRLHLPGEMGSLKEEPLSKSGVEMPRS